MSTPFLARVDPRSKARPGQRIEVVFNMDNMRAFDIESGKAMFIERIEEK